MDLLTSTALKARDGDRVALEGLMRLVQGDVWRLCKYMVDAQSADDLAQDALVKMIGSLHRVTAEHNVRAWTLGIARHTCLDEIRRRQRRRRLQKDYEGTRPLVAAPTDTSIDLRELISSIDLRELIANIDIDRRDAFVLTQLVGLSYEEVAAICECPIGTVRSRVARARLDLQALVGESQIAGTFPPPQATEKYGN